MEYHFTPLDAHGAKFVCVCVCAHFCLTPSAECVCLSENGLCMFISAVSSQRVNECGGWGSVNRVSNLSGTGGHI